MANSLREVVTRNPGQKGFVAQTKRWVVEQTSGTLMLHRRLARDYESCEASAESRIYRVMTAVMTRRLTGQVAPTWRGA